MCGNHFFLSFFYFLVPPKNSLIKFLFPFACVCNHSFIGKIFFGLKAKQTKINYWISRMNCYHSFDNSEAKQKKKKMIHRLRELIVDHLIRN
jgi:hypothetical protein